MKDLDDEECAMLRPLMTRFESISSFRLPWLDELHNLPGWVVQPSSRWVDLLERLRRDQLVTFEFDS